LVCDNLAFCIEPHGKNDRRAFVAQSKVTTDARLICKTPYRKPLELPMTQWLFVLLTLAFLSGGCTSGGTQAEAAKGQRTSKIAEQLIALHDEYSSHLALRSQEPFRSANRLVQIIDGRVVVDAVASGEASVLQADLMALGMRDSVTFGRIVSGQLPISSIPALATLPSLIFARAASAITQKNQPPVVPQRP